MNVLSRAVFRFSNTSRAAVLNISGRVGEKPPARPGRDPEERFCPSACDLCEAFRLTGEAPGLICSDEDVRPVGDGAPEGTALPLPLPLGDAVGPAIFRCHAMFFTNVSNDAGGVVETGGSAGSGPAAATEPAAASFTAPARRAALLALDLGLRSGPMDHSAPPSRSLVASNK